MKKTLYYFIRGLLFIFPIGATLVLVFAGVRLIDGLLSPWLEELIGSYIPGLGLVAIFIVSLMVGYFVHLLGKPLDYFIESTFARMPLVKIIYSSLRDFSEAFLGEKRKYTQPVIVQMTDSGIMKMGFITQSDVCQLGIENMVSVYFPHSYNFSGNLFLVPKNKIKVIKGNNTEIMKFIVSAGVTSLDQLDTKTGVEMDDIIKTKPLNKI